MLWNQCPVAASIRRVLGRAGQDGRVGHTRRADGRAEVIRYRLRVFAETTSPLIDYYRNRGILLAVDADQPPESVTTEILALLDKSKQDLP